MGDLRHYNFYRTYDPATGRYLEPDPIGLHGGINPFAYVDNNPVAEIDPLGLVAVGSRVSFVGVLPPLQSIIGFGEAFGAAWFRDEGLDQFVDKCSPEYIWVQRIGFLWSLGPFALRGLAAAGATRWGHFLNHNRICVSVLGECLVQGRGSLLEQVSRGRPSDRRRRFVRIRTWICDRGFRMSRRLEAGQQTMIAAVNSRLESLLASAPEVLRALPGSSTEEVADGDKSFLLTVWRDKLDSGLDRIVVQAYERRSLGFGYMHAAGFTLSANGEKHALAATELYDFT